jgi:hypothetical protein
VVELWGVWEFSWPGEFEPEARGVEESLLLVELKVRFRGDLGEARSLESGLDGEAPCFDDLADRSESLTLGEKCERDVVGGACRGVVEENKEGAAPGVVLAIVGF